MWYIAYNLFSKRYIAYNFYFCLKRYIVYNYLEIFLPVQGKSLILFEMQNSSDISMWTHACKKRVRSLVPEKLSFSFIFLYRVTAIRGPFIPTLVLLKTERERERGKWAYLIVFSFKDYEKKYKFFLRDIYLFNK